LPEHDLRFQRRRATTVLHEHLVKRRIAGNTRVGETCTSRDAVEHGTVDASESVWAPVRNSSPSRGTSHIGSGDREMGANCRTLGALQRFENNIMTSVLESFGPRNPHGDVDESRKSRFTGRTPPAFHGHQGLRAPVRCRLISTFETIFDSRRRRNREGSVRTEQSALIAPSTRLFRSQTPDVERPKRNFFFPLAISMRSAGSFTVLDWDTECGWHLDR
jgi:hypothetical protein